MLFAQAQALRHELAAGLGLGAVILVCSAGFGCTLALSFDGLSGGAEELDSGLEAALDSGPDLEAATLPEGPEEGDTLLENEATEGEAGDGPEEEAEAPLVEWLDCSQSNNKGEPRCSRPNTLTPGTVGGGITLNWSSDVQIHNGFLEGNSLIVAVSQSSPPRGAVLSIDLQTGLRTLRAGALKDVSATVLSRGTGVDLAGLRDVKPVSGGWVAYLNSATPPSVIPVDPVTGDRGTPRLLAMKCEGFAGDPLLPREFVGIAADPLGTLYVPVRRAADQGAGVARLTSSSCQVVSWSSNSDPSTNLGQGPPISSGAEFSGFHWFENKVWFTGFTSEMVQSVSTETGDRVIVSSPVVPVVGDGYGALGVYALTAHNGRIWTAGPVSYAGFELVEVDPSTGNRLGHDNALGAALGPLGYSLPQLWGVPGRPLLLLAFDGFVLYDPASDDSNVLSY